jgi:hypothetical protein
VVGQHDERGQVVVERAESVAHPAAGAGETGQLETGGLQQRGGAVHAGLADHVVNEGEVIDDAPSGATTSLSICRTGRRA